MECGNVYIIGFQLFGDSKTMVSVFVVYHSIRPLFQNLGLLCSSYAHRHWAQPEVKFEWNAFRCRLRIGGLHLTWWRQCWWTETIRFFSSGS